MSFLSKVGHFLAGSQESLEGEPDELSELEQAYLDETCSALESAALLEDRRTAATALTSFARLHRLVS